MKRRIYYARAMDGQPPEAILEQARAVESELAANSMQMVDPYTTVDREHLPIDPHLASDLIVKADLALLRGSDAVLMDLSIENWSYVGCICELVYAYTMDIPVFVYVGRTHNGSRHWLRYHATEVYQTRENAIGALADFLGVNSV